MKRKEEKSEIVMLIKEEILVEENYEEREWVESYEFRWGG